MAVEYSNLTTQTVAVNDNIAFFNGDRCCKKGVVIHNDNSGIFRIKGFTKNGANRAIFSVSFNSNVAISAAADGGVVEPVSFALVQNGEVLRNTISTVTPVAIGDQWHIHFDALLEIPCGCCDTISVRNISENTSVDVANANIIIDRIA